MAKGQGQRSLFVVALVVYCGAHLGYDPRKVPIGGGAAVGHALIRRWRETRPFGLLVWGTGPEAPAEGVAYEPMAVATNALLTEFSVSRYAQLSRAFEKAVVQRLQDLKKTVNPKEVLVLHNDVAEAGDFEAIARMGFPQAAIFHVDVVDYVAHIFLRDRVSAPTLSRLWRGLTRFGLARFMPDVVKLMLEKQEKCAKVCDLLLVPSTGMAAVLRASYPWRTERDVVVIPWGTLTEPPAAGVVEEQAALERLVGKGDTPVLVTLSRISPEKGQDLLLRALRLWDRREKERLRVLICGAPAYMHGQSYFRKLQALARPLRHVEVRFLGHVSGARKHAVFSLSDLYVFPSRHESYGLTMMEAMAAGLPILTTDHRSARDLVRPEFGQVVPTSVAGLYRGLVELLSRREELPKMGAEAQKFALSRPFSQAADALASALLTLVPTRMA